MAAEVVMPAMEMAQNAARLVRWLKAPGELVRKGEPLLEIETDKVTVEIEAPASGVLANVTAQAGDEVPVVFGDTGARPVTVAVLFDSKDLTGAYVMSTTAFDLNLPTVGDTQIWVRAADGVAVEDARAAVDAVLGPFPSAEVQDLAEFKAGIKAQYDIILLLVNALLALTIVIAMIGIVNTLVLSVVERSREIGLTRAVGASRGQVRATIRWEALLISGFGLAAALAVGVFFGWVLVRMLADEGFSVFALPAAQLVVFTAVTGVLTLAAAVLPAAWAGRRPVLSAIADR